MALSEYRSEISKDTPLPIREQLILAATRSPDALALVCPHQAADLYHVGHKEGSNPAEQQYLRWTYKHLHTAVSALVLGLEKHGVTSGMPIATFVGNSCEHVLLMWACHMLHCPFVPINPRNLLNTEEVTHMLCTARAAVIVAGDEKIAEQIDKINAIPRSLRIIISSQPANAKWISFDTLIGSTMDGSSPPPLSLPLGDISNDDVPLVILFTSGTTSLPKGCPLLDSNCAGYVDAWSRIATSGPHGSLPRGAAAHCEVIPTNHVLNWMFTVTNHVHGATVVFPATAFAPQAMFEAVELEKCTHTLLVPTMLRPLLEVAELKGRKLTSLQCIMLGGTIVTPKHMMEVLELGASSFNVAYGMTEGVVCNRRESHRDTNGLIRDGSAAVGKPPNGSCARICEPASKILVPRGTPGELHYSGPQLMRGYIGKESQDFYSDEDGQRWFVTGDQAVMDDDCNIYILGRYKDIIIRGGENISPGAMEMVLNENSTVNAQVVGTPDDIAGEVPVVVIEKLTDSTSTKRYFHDILKRMGPIYVPDEVLTLKDLGLDDYPRTMAGKVQKTKLAAIVRRFREERNTGVESKDTTENSLKNAVLRSWSRVTGIEISEIDTKAPINDFADSITLTRVRDVIQKETGKKLTLRDAADATTIDAQLKLLVSQPVGSGKVQKEKPRRKVPPTVSDIVNLTGREDQFEDTKQNVQRSIGQYGFSWTEDVEDVMPTYDYIKVLAQRRVIDSWNWRFSILPAHADSKLLRKGLEAVIANNSLLRSFLLWHRPEEDSDMVYVTIRPGRKLFDLCIIDHGTVKSVLDLERLAWTNPYPKHAKIPGPLFSALVVFVEETQSSAVMLNINHAIMDASYTQYIFEDLDRVLGAPDQALPKHIDYKPWADSYFSLRTSLKAKVDIAWHVKRLSQLHLHRKALYPPAHAPRRATDEEFEGLDHEFDVPEMRETRQAHGHLSAPIFLKSALALLNVHYTKHTHALFSNLEAARTSFPFIPAELESIADFDATDVAGPTFQSVINLVEVRNDEPVLSFLSRMQEDQNGQTAHASVPWIPLMAALGTNGKGTGAGDLLPELLNTQVFNWVPGMSRAGGNPYSNFEIKRSVCRSAVGLVVRGGLGGEKMTKMLMHLRWDVANMRREQAEGIARDLEKVTVWLTRKETWTRPVGEFVAQL